MHPEWCLYWFNKDRDVYRSNTSARSPAGATRRSQQLCIPARELRVNLHARCHRKQEHSCLCATVWIVCSPEICYLVRWHTGPSSMCWSLRTLKILLRKHWRPHSRNGSKPYKIKIFVHMLWNCIGFVAESIYSAEGAEWIRKFIFLKFVLRASSSYLWI